MYKAQDIENKIRALRSAYDDITPAEEEAYRRHLTEGGFFAFRSEFVIIPEADTWLPSGLD